MRGNRLVCPLASFASIENNLVLRNYCRAWRDCRDGRRLSRASNKSLNLLLGRWRMKYAWPKTGIHMPCRNHACDDMSTFGMRGCANLKYIRIRIYSCRSNSRNDHLNESFRSNVNEVSFRMSCIRMESNSKKMVSFFLKTANGPKKIQFIFPFLVFSQSHRTDAIEHRRRQNRAKSIT